ncbi:MAG: antitoxin [Acidobacteria bacterium]|nr:antitoxin [Acidobacteriota bacterium]
MRTTLTLDPDVARMLGDEAHRQRKPFKQVVNDAIRKGLAPAPAGRGGSKFRVRPHKTALRAGIDGLSFNRLADEFDEDATARALQRDR